jgi:hypothetical protein
MAKGGMNDTVVWISKIITTSPSAELEYLRFLSNSYLKHLDLSDLFFLLQIIVIYRILKYTSKIFRRAYYW